MLEDECGPDFLTFVLQLGGKSQKNLNQEIDSLEDRTRAFAWEVTMLPLGQIGGLKHLMHRLNTFNLWT